MLFRNDILEKIAAGMVTRAFRRWRRPSVKAGGRLRTSVGELAIEAVDRVDESTITSGDALRAGFESLKELLDDLRSQRAGTLYRIRFHLAGPDSRVALREKDDLPKAELDTITRRLDRLDRASKTGPWTRGVLMLIAAHPQRRAGELARLGGFEKERLKINVRKLKNLGLTESLNPGYRLSPRGKAVLKKLGRYREGAY